MLRQWPQASFAPDLAGVEAQRAADDQLDHDTPLAEVFEDQVACADLILLTKSDLAGQSEKDKAREDSRCGTAPLAGD